MKHKYHLKSLKEMLLINTGYAYCAIGKLNEENTAIEEELLLDVMHEVAKNHTGSRKQYKKLLGLYYMVRGMLDNLRLGKVTPTDITFHENEVPF